MATSFYPLNNSGGAAIQLVSAPNFVPYSSVGAPVTVPPGTNGSGGIDTFQPIQPLPGSVFGSSQAM